MTLKANNVILNCKNLLFERNWSLHQLKILLMPEISRFFGIIIRMFFNDHQPPHFHAEYAQYEGVFSIVDLRMIEGHLPKRVRNISIRMGI